MFLHFPNVNVVSKATTWPYATAPSSPASHGQRIAELHQYFRCPLPSGRSFSLAWAVGLFTQSTRRWRHLTSACRLSVPRGEDHFFM